MHARKGACEKDIKGYSVVIYMMIIMDDPTCS
jgi:hypothetical protein